MLAHKFLGKLKSNALKTSFLIKINIFFKEIVNSIMKIMENHSSLSKKYSMILIIFHMIQLLSSVLN